MGTKKESKHVTTPMFRVSFPDIKERSNIDGVKGKFRIVMLFDKDADISELIAAAKAARIKKWPSGTPNKFNNPFKKVDNMDDEDKYDGMVEGMVVISAASSYRPGVVDQKQVQIDIEELDTYLYGGMYARAIVSAFPWEFAKKKGVAFGLEGIQIMKDGEPLGSRINVQDAFADVEDADDYDTDDTTGDDTDEFDL